MTAEKNTAADRARQEAETIVEEASDVQQRIRDTLVSAFGEGQAKLSELPEIASAMMDGAMEVLDQSAPKDSTSVLRQVTDGLSDGMTSTANAARLAVEEARGRGETFAREDLQRMVDDLKTIEQLMVDSTKETFDRFQELAGDQMKDLRDHVDRAYAKARPAIEEAISAAMKHPGQFAGETAKAGAQAVPRTAGMLLQAVGGILQGAGDVLSSAGKRSAREEGKGTVDKGEGI